MHNKIVILYFALLAVAMGLLRVLGINPSMQVILIAMAAAGLIILVSKLITRAIRRKIARYGLNGRQWLAVMMGYSPDVMQVVDAEPGPYYEPTTDPLPPSRNLPALYQEPYQDEEGEELPEAILEPDGMYLADTFQPGIQSILGSTMLITGIRRSGKSNAIAVLVEELGRYTLPMLVCDTEDEYAGLVDRQYLPHGFMAGSPDAHHEISAELRRMYIPVDEEGAFAFGQGIMDGHLQVILNLKSYETDDKAARVMCEIIKGINAWEEARANRDRVPCEIVLDEATKWLPQNIRESSVSKEVQDLLHHTFFGTIVRLGGKRGFGLVVAAQRIVELDKRCLQSMWKLLFKQTEEVDVARYERQGLPREQVLTLRQGECFVFCPQAIGFRVRMRERTSPHLAHTPGLEQLGRQRERARAMRDMVARRGYARPAVASQQQQGAMPAMSTQDGEDREEFAEEIPVRSPEPNMPPSLDAKHQRALELWHQGKRNHRVIAAVMGITENAAYSLIINLDEKGYIQRKKKVGV